MERQDLEQAFDMQSKLIHLGQRSPELFYNTGLLLQKSGQLEDAVKHYRQALTEKPNIAEALLNLGHALKALGQEDEARTCWRKALESNPDLAASYFAG
jgi:tetratricopeptide (TPR) repeat protein